MCCCIQLTSRSTRDLRGCASQKVLTDRLTMGIELAIMTWSCSVCKTARVTLVKHSTTQHSTAQAMHRVDFCLTHELYAYICLPAVIASLQHMSTSRDGGCNSCEQPGLNVPFAFEGLTGAAESMDNSRYLTTLQHEGCHRRRLSAVLQRKGSGVCMPPCICQWMHANSRYAYSAQSSKMYMQLLGAEGCHKYSS